MEQDAYLLLGTNLGDRLALLELAVECLTAEAGKIVALSSVYGSAAWGKADQPDFLNRVVRLATPLPPLQLLHVTQQIENRLGRERLEKWGARLIDIDILLYADITIDHPRLQIPHPHLPDRRFALMPLHEVAPLAVHPLLQCTVTELLKTTTDPLPVWLHKNEKGS